MSIPRLFVVGLALALGACSVYRTEGPPEKRSDQVFVCHKGSETLRLPDNAVRAHLNHGDRLGACQPGT